MARIYGRTKIGKDCFIGEQVILGYPGKDEKHLLIEGRTNELEGADIGDGCIIRDFGVVYSRASLGDRVQTGHHYLVRERTCVGEGTLIGSGVIIDDRCTIGKKVSLQTGVYIPTATKIEDHVFLGPRAVITNDRYMGREENWLEPVVIKKGARIGANSVILPGITVGEEAVVGAGAVVTKNVPSFTVVLGNPAKIVGEVPENQRTRG